MKNIHQHIVLKLKLRKKFNFKLDKVKKHIFTRVYVSLQSDLAWFLTGF